ncbi:hypothetical protein FACS1894102_1110 [Spirochaetia bacterium]|nr:hypothetical protein FACS1894102_1110 [Spirochaetia bacterium]
MNRFLVFFYDILRLSIFYLMIQLSNIDGGNLDLFLIPLIAYIAPVTLFPIMSFFLWRDPQRNRPFAALYTAGKLISCCAVIMPFISWMKAAMPSIQFWSRPKLFFNISIPLMIILDIVTVFIVLKIMSVNVERVKE